MKRILLFIMMLCIILATLGCAHSPEDNWQTIRISACGTLKIPQEWRMFEWDGRVYIVDADNQPVMIQTHSYCGAKDDMLGATESNAYFVDVTNIKILASAVLSNGAIFGELLVSCDNILSTKYYLKVGNERIVKFVVWDETIDEEMLHKIAETFTAELSTD